MDNFKPYEPKRLNRFLVKLSEDVGIPDYYIHSIDLPIYSYENSWGEMMISFYNPIDFSIQEKLIKNISTISNVLELFFLSPTNEVVETWEIEYKPINIMNCSMNWLSDDLMVTSLSITPISIKIKV